MSRYLFYFIFLWLVISGRLLAAPIPVTSSSFLISSQKGKFISEHGFSINAEDTDWQKSPLLEDNSSIVVHYRAPTTHRGVQAGLTVRVEDLNNPQTLKHYVKSWLKDYPRLGFQILASRPIKINQQKAFLLDMINNQSHKQLRQVIFLKNKKVAILTCRDHRDTFQMSINNCNSIISHFHWNI